MELNNCKYCGGKATTEYRDISKIGHDGIIGIVYLGVCPNCRSCSPNYYTNSKEAGKAWNEIHSKENKNTEDKLRAKRNIDAIVDAIFAECFIRDCDTGIITRSLICVLEDFSKGFGLEVKS